MKSFGISGRSARRLLAGAGAVTVAAGLSCAALAADATTSTVIKGCFNSSSGALRVLTPHSKSCGSERSISWNQAGPPGNGYAFSSTTNKLDKFNEDESDGPTVTKAGTYFVNVNAKLNIAAYLSPAGVEGFCALDLVHVNANADEVFVFEIFSNWGYPAPAKNLNNVYPFSSSGMVHVTAKQTGDQLALFCLDSSFATVSINSGTWLVSPVSATTSATVNVGHSTVGPAGVRPKPALKP